MNNTVSRLEAARDAEVERKLVWVPNTLTPVALIEIFEGWALVEDSTGLVHAVDADQVEYAYPT
ncbi:hypothetical protein N825_07330 [Skermanella stibiiresistens SB22]|uniref:Uncharacterized protein n=1 Tax=Skermanella stibiiresistens SB22 TaxID=1385369 RepID=W9H3A9_9PROT|nr:hypothetical protein [Skermanella stibiiresistens]EWY39281.1 hypothetical protein N825_07330 [Skermanella stibiiresistens SB22]